MVPAKISADTDNIHYYSLHLHGNGIHEKYTREVAKAFFIGKRKIDINSVVAAFSIWTSTGVEEWYFI